MALTHKSSPVQRPSILLIKGIYVGSFTEQEVHHLTERKRAGGELRVCQLALRIQPSTEAPTSVWPLRAAWCSAVRPPRSDTLTLLRSGMITSAQRRALLAAATCSGVCQFLSLAFTSAEWWIRTSTASCGTRWGVILGVRLQMTLEPEQNIHIAIHGSNRDHLMLSTCVHCVHPLGYRNCALLANCSLSVSLSVCLSASLCSSWFYHFFDFQAFEIWIITLINWTYLTAPSSLW